MACLTVKGQWMQNIGNKCYKCNFMQSSQRNISMILKRNKMNIYNLDKNSNNMINIRNIKNEIYFINNKLIHNSAAMRCCEMQVMADKTGDKREVETKKSNPKVDKIIEEIAQLNLMDVSYLVNGLKEKLNIPDSAMMGGGMIMANAMPAQASGTPGGADAAKEEEEPQREQTIFEVILKGFKDDKKVNVIKEVRAIFQLGLKEAKAMVEKAPVTLASNCPKVDADGYKEKLEAVGAEIVLE